MDFNQVSEWLSKWGFWQLMCIFIITGLTMALKIPIKKAAEKYQEKTGVDKSFVTWTISVIPLVLGFVAALLLELWGLGWDVDQIDWADVTKQATVLGGASIGVFEAFKKWAEALTAKKNAKAVEEAKTESEAIATEAKAEEASSETKVLVAVPEAKAVEETKSEAKKPESESRTISLV